MSFHRKLSSLALGTAAVALLAATPADARVDGDTITLGAALSLTGKYTTAGNHTKRGYELAAERINSRGGVTVGGKKYKIKLKFYYHCLIYKSQPSYKSWCGGRIQLIAFSAD